MLPFYILKHLLSKHRCFNAYKQNMKTFQRRDFYFFKCKIQQTVKTRLLYGAVLHTIDYKFSGWLQSKQATVIFSIIIARVQWHPTKKIDDA